MSRSQRLVKLMQQLRSMSPPIRASELAQAMDVSLRSIYRDIDSLRSMGAVIDGEAGFGYRLIEDPALPPMMFSRQEMEALVLGLREVQQVGDPALASAAENALSKLRACLPNRMAEQMEHSVLHAKKFAAKPIIKIDSAALREATWNELAVNLSYKDAQDEASERRVFPLSIVYMDSAPALMAWCKLRQGYRTFRLDRIVEMTISDESFRPRRVSMLREFLQLIEKS